MPLKRLRKVCLIAKKSLSVELYSQEIQMTCYLMKSIGYYLNRKKHRKPLEERHATQAVSTVFWSWSDSICITPNWLKDAVQVGPGYYAQAGRSASSLGIPRFHQRPKSPKSRTRSLAGSSPRLEYPRVQPPPTMASVESQEWYSGYQHQVPHDAEFGSSGSFGGLNYDGRIQAAIGRANPQCASTLLGFGNINDI